MCFNNAIILTLSDTVYVKICLTEIQASDDGADELIKVHMGL